MFSETAHHHRRKSLFERKVDEDAAHGAKQSCVLLGLWGRVGSRMS